MAQRVTKNPPAEQRETLSRIQPGNDVGQGELPTMAAADVLNMQRRLREWFYKHAQRERKFTWLAAALGKKISYDSKISEAATGSPDRRVQLEWLAPLFVDPAKRHEALIDLMEILLYQPPVPKVLPTADDLIGPMIDKFDRMGDVGKSFIEELATKRGMTVDQLRRVCGR